MRLGILCVLGIVTLVGCKTSRRESVHDADAERDLAGSYYMSWRTGMSAAATPQHGGGVPTAHPAPAKGASVAAPPQLHSSAAKAAPAAAGKPASTVAPKASPGAVEAVTSKSAPSSKLAPASGSSIAGANTVASTPTKAALVSYRVIASVLAVRKTPQLQSQAVRFIAKGAIVRAAPAGDGWLRLDDGSYVRASQVAQDAG